MNNNFENETEGTSYVFSQIPDRLTKEAFFYIHEIGYMEVDSQFCICGENRDCYLLLYIANFKGKLVYENQEYSLKAGDIFLIDCNKKYNFFGVSKNGIHFIYMYFNGKQANGMYNIITADSNYIYNLSDPKHIASMLWYIINIYKSKQDKRDAICNLQISKILTDIILLKENLTDEKIEYPTYINQIFHHVGHFYDEKITLDSLSEIYLISKYHLAREFKRYTGITIHDYIVKTRISQAKHLLKHTDENINKIAIRVGFFSGSHLIKAFKKFENITPNEYRSFQK